MTSPLPRLTAPCSENLDAMEKTARGFFCDKCQHDVVDLRRAPRKKALAVLAELRSQSRGGRVCVRAMVRSDGTPVFSPDAPSMLSRFAAPLALASSLAACAPSSRAEGTTPVVLVTPPVTNTNGTAQSGTVVSSTTTTPPSPQPTTVIVDMPPIDAAGGMVWEGGP